MKKLFVSIVTLFLTVAVFAQDIPERPNPPRLVNDLANVLSADQVQQLEAELVQFNNATSTQIAVVTVPTLNGNDPSDFAFRLGEKWGVGQKDKNNGIVVLFKPKSATEKGQVFVAVGYGLEGVIPDAIANRDVVDNEMIPRFKVNDVYGGLYNGTKVLMALAANEYTAEQYHQSAGKKQAGGIGIFVFFIFIFLIVSIFRGKSRQFYSGGSSLPFWVAMGMMGAGRNSHSGSWGNFSGGGGSFGGFGGGSFGGGGAGGSW